MSTRFKHAILRRPGRNFSAGLTSGAGAPDIGRALVQHAAYENALAACGVATTVLPADEGFPDGTFVEDTAILTARGAVITRPGAASRLGETATIAPAVARFFDTVRHIEAPGTVDGGDVCQCDDHFLIGVSARTNEAGAEALAGILREFGYRATLIDIRRSKTLLHLKTGLSYLGDGRLAVAGELPAAPVLQEFEHIRAEADESYAANCIRVNDRVLVASGYPKFLDRLSRLGCQPMALDMSEFRKMDGGLSCLSLRF